MRLMKRNRPWTSEEEEALRAGVTKHGYGHWKKILNDPQFSSLLSRRSNVDLKDKWRNMSAGTDAKGKPILYEELIFEAISTTRDSNGADLGSISRYIERKFNEAPQSSGNSLGPRLAKLVIQGKLEKIGIIQR